MTREQKELLYQIADLHNKEFYNNMNDRWTAQDYAFNRRCAEQIV